MSLTVWKFTLAVLDSQAVALPRGARVLCVQWQGEQLQLWALCDPRAVKVKRHFSIYGTGHAVRAADEQAHYVGTVQDSRGLVWHVFERQENQS